MSNGERKPFSNGTVKWIALGLSVVAMIISATGAYYDARAEATKQMNEAKAHSDTQMDAHEEKYGKKIEALDDKMDDFRTQQAVTNQILIERFGPPRTIPSTDPNS